MPNRAAPPAPRGTQFEFTLKPFEYKATPEQKEADRKNTEAWAKKPWAVRNGKLIVTTWEEQPQRRLTGRQANVIRMGKVTSVNTFWEKIDDVEREVVPGCIEFRNGEPIEILTAVIEEDETPDPDDQEEDEEEAEGQASGHTRGIAPSRY